MVMDVLICVSFSLMFLDVSWLVVYFFLIVLMMNVNLGVNFGEYCDLMKILKLDLLLKIFKFLEKLDYMLIVEVGKGINCSLY